MHARSEATPETDNTGAYTFGPLTHDGGVFGYYINQYAGLAIARLAARRGIHPTVLTLTSLVVGIAASIVGIIGADGETLIPGLVVLFGLQVAYALDCADGLLARATGTASDAGARLDALVDTAVRAAVVGVVLTFAFTRSDLPPAAGAAFVVLWMSSLVFSLFGHGSQSVPHLVRADNWVIRLAKSVRDYSLHIIAIGLVMIFQPSAMGWLVVAIAIPNGLVLIANIARDSLQSMRRGV